VGVSIAVGGGADRRAEQPANHSTGGGDDRADSATDNLRRRPDPAHCRTGRMRARRTPRCRQDLAHDDPPCRDNTRLVVAYGSNVPAEQRFRVSERTCAPRLRRLPTGYGAGTDERQTRIEWARAHAVRSCRGGHATFAPGRCNVQSRAGGRLCPPCDGVLTPHRSDGMQPPVGRVALRLTSAILTPAVHQPRDRRAVVVAPDDVRLAVAIEVADLLMCQSVGWN